MPTLKEIIKLSTDYLNKAGHLSPRIDAEWLIAHALGLKRIDLYLQFDQPLEESQLAKIRSLIARRAKGEPVQYICGTTEFYGLELKVGPGVMVPRPETELLVDEALKRSKAGFKVLDLCTGSGAIAVALKKENPQLHLTAVDISREALHYATENIRQNDVDIDLLEGDLFAPVVGCKFDLITVNPPYVKHSEKVFMGPDVLAHEPALALFAGPDGLAILSRLALDGRMFLEPGGILIAEIGFKQGIDCQRLFAANAWSSATIIKDYAGKDRFVLCQNNAYNPLIR